MDAKDIDNSLADDVLTSRGEKKQEKDEADENYHRVERSYRAFSRCIRLPHEVQSDKIKASYKDGVLKVTVPKSEEAKKEQIKINVQ